MSKSMFERSWSGITEGSVDAEKKDTGYIRISAGASGGGGGGAGGLLSLPVIFSSYQATVREKLQILETFNEFIHVYAFGRAVGSATLSGYVLATDGTLDALKDELLSAYETKLRARKLADEGALAIISGPGGAVIQGVVASLSFSVSAEGGAGDNFVRFSMDLITAGGQESPISATGVS